MKTSLILNFNHPKTGENFDATVTHEDGEIFIRPQRDSVDGEFRHDRNSIHENPNGHIRWLAGDDITDDLTDEQLEWADAELTRAEVAQDARELNRADLRAIFQSAKEAA